MTEKKFTEFLAAVLDEAEQLEVYDDIGGPRPVSSATFDEVGLLTGNKGLVITMDDDSEFQLTVVQSREGDNEEAED